MSEFEVVLDHLTARIVRYVKDAEANEAKVTQLFEPEVLATAQAEQFPLGAEGLGFGGFQPFAEFLLANSVATWNPRFLEKLYAGTNAVGVATDLLLSVLNTNSHVFTAAPALSVVEKYVARKYAQMFGLGAQSGGLTFPGGSYSNITAMHIARSLRFSESREEGNGRYAVFTSQHAHYSIEKAAVLLGLGSRSVYKVEVDAEGCMKVADLETKVAAARADGRKPFFVAATAGTTVLGSFDPLDEIAKVARKHGLWLHVDGSWGGNVVFSENYRYKLKGSEQADSITVNPHKMLGVPCTCSFLLLPESTSFVRANAMEAGYLFHEEPLDSEPVSSKAAEGSAGKAVVEDTNYDLASGTMACGRRADALKLFTAWQWYGTAGLGARIDHAFAMTAHLSRRVAEHPDLLLVTPEVPPCLQTCFFFAPGGKLAPPATTSALTRYISAELRRNSEFLIDYTPEDRGEFFRVVVVSPSVTPELLDELVAAIVRHGREFSH